MKKIEIDYNCPECLGSGVRVKTAIGEIVSRNPDRFYWKCRRCKNEGFVAKMWFEDVRRAWY